ncbi:MAG: DNA polymerase sliding clamp [Candidatus Aenigmarchaeota archaeon]|nr:DNA polymerase sliding clamp [Candidatus Aenigmarchaeota archaeon]MCX8190869.1 DNA polymerase sliding clamp [Candidatus Aenigmarchaeota archaeon]MDW8159871.1 DNA polymerase sliding clamp [Candidatus Aenigmarchaeota archaeon]
MEVYFKASTKEPEIIITAVQTAAEIIDEGIFKLGKDGISLTAADRAMIAVIDIFISKDVFDEYEVGEEKEIGVNMTNFLSVLKRASGSEKLSIELYQNRLIVTIFDGTKRKFYVPLLEIAKEEIPPIHQLEFKAKVTIKPELLKDAIEDAEIITDAVTFHAKKSSFQINAEGDISKSELELSEGEDGLVELDVKEESKAKYPIDYLQKILKAAKISDEVSIMFSQDYPMRMDFKSENKARISMVLAPRVSE